MSIIDAPAFDPGIGADLGSLGTLTLLPDHSLWAQTLADAGLDGGGVGSEVPGITVHASPAGTSSAGRRQGRP